MRPQIEHMTCVPTEDGAVPAEYWTEADHGPRTGDDETGYFCRLSAPGYMDCTEWDGPYETPKEALDALCDAYAQDDEEDAAYRACVGLDDGRHPETLQASMNDWPPD